MNACPSDEDLGAFLTGGGGGVSVADHLRRCARCQETADRLSALDVLGAASARSEGLGWDWEGDAALASIVESLKEDSPFRSTRRGSDGSNVARATLGETPDRLGPYDVGEELGRGGMGVVFRAADRTTGRVVALKVLYAAGDDSSTKRRFLREVRAAATVEHDHVVRLYATSEPDAPAPFFAMEYLPGPNLAEMKAPGGGRLDPRRIAELVAQAARGLDAAHRLGLVHGDVKPSNVLIDHAAGRAKIADFGLARIAADGPWESREGVLAGTPAYMSPEQARGEAALDPRTDVYSLGVSLYECLTGEVPFRGEPHRIIHQILRDEPRAPRLYNDAIPRDLETICLKAMAKEASKRYQAASDFADDLGRFLRGEPIRARPVGSLERAWRWCRNNRRVACLAALAAALLIAVAAVSATAAVRIDRERTRAVEQARIAEARRAVAFDALNSLIEGVQERLASRPGTLEIRRSLLEIARDGLAKLETDLDAADHAAVDGRAIVSLIKLGDVEMILGRTDEALARFDRAASLAERASASEAESVDLRLKLALAYDSLGHVLHRQSRRDESLARFEKAHAVRARVVAEHPELSQPRRDLRISLGNLGDAADERQDLSKAREYFEASRRSLLAEPENTPDRRQWLKDLRWIHGRIGRVAWREGRKAEALAALRESLARAEDLCSLDPQNADARRQRAFAQDYLGEISIDFDELDEAQRALTAFRDDRESASRDDPADLEVMRSTGLAHQHLGNLAARRGDYETAASEYHRALAIYAEVAARNKSSVEAHKDRLICLRQIANMEADRDRFEAVVEALDRELELQAGKDVPPHADQAGWIEEAKLLREVFILARRALDDPGLARRQSPRVEDLLRKVRALALARAGRAAEAAAAAEELLAMPDAAGGALIAARTYAVLVGRLDDRNADQRSRFLKACIEALRRSIHAAPRLAGLIEFDPRLKAVKDDPEFRALLPRR